MTSLLPNISILSRLQSTMNATATIYLPRFLQSTPPLHPRILSLLIFTILLGISYRIFVLLSLSTQSKLNGPPNPSLLFGSYRLLNESDDPGLIYEHWEQEYGPAFRVPGGFGSSRIVICDPRANAHFYSKETFGYVQTKLSRVFIENLVCDFFSLLHTQFN